MIGALRLSNRTHWSEAAQWLMYTVVLGAFPFWGVALLLWLANRPLDAALLTSNAQLAVYGAGLLASALPLMHREIKDTPFQHPKWFIGIAILVLLCAATLFAAVTVVSSTDAAGQFVGAFPVPSTSTGDGVFGWRPDPDRVLWFSVILAGMSLTLAFLTELLHNIRVNPDIRRMKRRDVDELSSKVMRKLHEEAE